MGKQARQQVLRDLLLCPEHLAAQALAVLPAHVRERAQALRAEMAGPLQVWALGAGCCAVCSCECTQLVQLLLHRCECRVVCAPL